MQTGLHECPVSHLFSEVIAKDPIPVPQQVTRELVKGKCLPQLLPRLFSGWVGGHIKVQNATPVMGQHQKHVKDAEADSGNFFEPDTNLGDANFGTITGALAGRTATLGARFSF